MATATTRKFMSIKSAAERLGVCRHTLMSRVKAGQLPIRYTEAPGLRPRLVAEDVERLTQIKGKAPSMEPASAT